MSASTETAKLTKKDKKLKKKQHKSRDMLEKHEGIKISEIPTKVVISTQQLQQTDIKTL
jgi:hypothetical protein